MIKAVNLKLLIFLQYQNKKSIFTKGYNPNWSEELFVIKNVKNTVLWIYVNNDLNGEEIVGIFSEKELQKTNRKEFKLEDKLEVDKLVRVPVDLSKLSDVVKNNVVKKDVI